MKKSYLIFFILLFSISLLAQNKFYVIVGAFSTEQAAKNECISYRKLGFDDAKMLISPDNKVYRVSVAEYNNYKDASKAIIKYSRKRIIPLDSWTTDNTKLTGLEVTDNQIIIRRIEHIEKQLNNSSTQGGLLNSSDISDIDTRLNEIENLLEVLLSRLEQTDAEFKTIKEISNNLVLRNYANGDIYSNDRDEEISDIRRELNSLREDKENAMINSKPEIENNKEPEIKKDKKDTKKIKAEKAAAEKVLKAKQDAEATKKKEEEAKKLAASKKKNSVSYSSFKFTNPDVIKGTTEAYQLVYEGYNNALSSDKILLKYNITPKDTTNDNVNYNLAYNYFTRYAKFDGNILGASDQAFVVGKNQKKNGKNFGTSRGYLKGYITGRIDYIVKNKQIKNVKNYLAKVDIMVNIPEKFTKLKTKDKKEFNKYFETAFHNAFIQGYKQGYKKGFNNN